MVTWRTSCPPHWYVMQFAELRIRDLRNYQLSRLLRKPVVKCRMGIYNFTYHSYFIFRSQLASFFQRCDRYICGHSRPQKFPLRQLLLPAFCWEMRSSFGYFISMSILVCPANAFQNIANSPHFRFRSDLYFSPPRDAPADTLAIAIEKLPVPDAAVNVLLENMPLAEKYSLLLQSYATNIIDDSNRSVAALDTMDSLYAEMISKSIAPSEKSSKLLIDASSTFCSSMKLGKSLQLAKAGEKYFYSQRLIKLL